MFRLSIQVITLFAPSPHSSPSFHVRGGVDQHLKGRARRVGRVGRRGQHGGQMASGGEAQNAHPGRRHGGRAQKHGNFQGIHMLDDFSWTLLDFV